MKINACLYVVAKPPYRLTDLHENLHVYAPVFIPLSDIWRRTFIINYRKTQNIPKILRVLSQN